MEDLQVRNYSETIKKADLQEDLEALVNYVEQFIMKNQGNLQAQDYYAFKELNQED